MKSGRGRGPGGCPARTVAGDVHVGVGPAISPDGLAPDVTGWTVGDEVIGWTDERPRTPSTSRCQPIIWQGASGRRPFVRARGVRDIAYPDDTEPTGCQCGEQDDRRTKSVEHPNRLHAH